MLTQNQSQQIYISEAASEGLTEAAQTLQSWLMQEEGTHYAANDLRACLVEWLESSIEQLVSDAPFLAAQSDRTQGFNQQAFKQALKSVSYTVKESA
ncbi:MAG: hypothetical protein KME11_04740 [Timaviella obliquedivisa GSE-PSE-MK23-08B]|jgi:hypothetical protein|nr:hypothetical protein [Timaviella obliquedivisa GSE-PSE-MK23-08B]